MRAAALLSGAALSAAVLTACVGGASEPPFLSEESPTPTAAATESGGMDGFREFAALIDEAVTSGDGILLTARMPTQSVRALRGDVVDYASWQEVRSWFESLVSEAVAEESDVFGGGEAILYAVARTGESRYQAIVTAIEPSRYRRIGVYEFTFRDSRWRLVTASMDPGWSPEVFLTGDCTECYDHWERWEGTP